MLRLVLHPDAYLERKLILANGAEINVPPRRKSPTFRREGVEVIEEVGPSMLPDLMPAHCTGWSAMHQIARAMPESFIANSVGTTLVL